MALSPIEGVPIPMMSPHPVEAAPVLTDQTKGPDEGAFSDVLLQMIASANNQSHHAYHAAHALAQGQSDDIHGTMIEMSKASIQTKLVANVKNKVVDAFYELWRMSI